MGKKIKPRQLSFKPRDPMAHLLQDDMFHQRVVKDKRRVPKHKGYCDECGENPCGCSSLLYFDD